MALPITTILMAQVSKVLHTPLNIWSITNDDSTGENTFPFC